MAAAADDYRVVMVLKPSPLRDDDDDDDYSLTTGKSEVKVYSLTTNSWRIEDRPLTFNLSGHEIRVLANSALHWFADNTHIVSFDLKDEVFREVSLGLCLTLLTDFNMIGVLEGQLCVILNFGVFMLRFG